MNNVWHHIILFLASDRFMFLLGIIGIGVISYGAGKGKAYEEIDKYMDEVKNEKRL